MEPDVGWWAEAGKLWWLGSPIVITYLLSFCIPLVTMVSVGHLPDPSALAAAALGQLTFNITGVSLMIGLLSGLDTLGSQAFGAGQLDRLVVLLHRSLALTAMASAPVVVVWALWADGLMRLVVEDPQVASLAAEYLRMMIPSLVALVAFEAVKRWLQVQRIVTPMVLAAGLSIAPHIGLCWLLVHRLQLGLPGGAIASAVSYWLMLLMLLVIVKARHPTEAALATRFRPGLLSGPAVLEYLRLAVPGVLMLTLEWWSFEFLAVAAARLGTVALAAHAIAANLIPLCFMIPLGLGTAAGVRIGNALGESEPAAARLTAQVSLSFSSLIGLLVAGLAYVGRELVARCFSSDRAVVDAASQAMPWVAAFLLLDSYQGTNQGIFRGAGQQALGAGFIIVGNFGVGLPAAVALGLGAGWGLSGLWAGMCLGYALVALAFTVALSRISWQAVPSQVQQRTGHEPVEGMEVQEYDAVEQPDLEANGVIADGEPEPSKDTNVLLETLPSRATDSDQDLHQHSEIT